MAANAETGIDYDNDRFVKITAHDINTFDINDPSTYRVDSFNARWLRTDGGQANGANPAVMYFKKQPPATEDGDHRYRKVIQREMLITVDPVDTSLPVGTYQEKEVLEKYSNEELKAQVDVAFNRQVEKQVVSVESSLGALILHTGSLAKKSENQVATPEQQARIDAGIAATDIVEQLEAKRQEFYAAIDADEDYDLTIWMDEE